MNETMKFVLRKSLKYIWLSVAVALALTLVYILPRVIAPEPITASDAEAPVESLAPSVQWETQPEVPRYIIYTLEPKKALFENEYFISDPMLYLGQYKDLLWQQLLSVENLFPVYQDLTDRYEGLSSVYSCENMLDEMIERCPMNQSTILIRIRSPFSLSRTPSAFSLSNEDLCNIRDFVYSRFAGQIDGSDACDGFPLRLRRASGTIEAVFSEQSYLCGLFTLENDSYAADNTVEGSAPGISKRKAALIFLLGFGFSFALIVFFILGDGKIKSAEELSELTNLEVYDDFLHADYEDAVKMLSAKIGTKSLPDPVPLVSLQVLESDARRIAEDLTAKSHHSFVLMEWNSQSGNTSLVTSLCGASCFLLVGRDKTKKSELRNMAKAFSQMNAVCLGAIICR